MKKCSSQTFLTVQSLWIRMFGHLGLEFGLVFFCLLINVSCYKYCIWQDLQTTSVCNMSTFKKQISVMTMVRRENEWRQRQNDFPLLWMCDNVENMSDCSAAAWGLHEAGFRSQFSQLGSCFCLHFKTIVLLRNVEKLHTAEVTVFSAVNHQFVS